MFVVNKFTVEVRKDDSGLYPLMLLDFNPSEDGPLMLLKSEDNWLPEQWIDPTTMQLFESPTERTPEELKERLQTGCQVEAFYAVKQGAPNAWYPGQMVGEKGGMYTVNLQLNPPRPVHILSDQLRLAHDPVPVANIQKFVYDVKHAPPEVTDEKYLKMFAEYGKLNHLRLDPDKKLIIILALINSQLTAQFIHNLYTFHFRHGVQRQQHLDEIAKLRRELTGAERQPKHFTCEFDIVRFPDGGSYSHHMYNARSLPGIIRILVDGTHVKITAVNEVVMIEARQMLEVVREVLFVESDLVRHIIGKKGENVRMITKETGVGALSVFDDAAHMERFTDRKLEIDWVEGSAAIAIIGPRSSVDNAKMLIQFQIDTAKEIDKERSDRRRPANGSRQGQLSRQSTEERGTEQKPASPVVAPVENGVNGRPEEKDVVPPIQNARFPGASRRNSQNQRRDNFEGDRNQRRENFNGERRNSRRSDNSYGPEDARHLNEELPRGDTEDATQDGAGRRRSLPNGRPEDQNQRPPNSFNRRSSNRGRRGGAGGGGVYRGEVRNGPVREAGDNNGVEHPEANGKPVKSNLPSPQQSNGHPAVDEEGFMQARGKNRKNRPRQPGSESAANDAGDQ